MTTTDLNNNLLDHGQVQKAVAALFEYQQKSNKESFLEEGQNIQMQMTFKLIPDVENKNIKIPLPTSLMKEASDICLFVKDLDKNDRDFESTVDHFKDLLSEKGVTKVAEVIPLKQLKLEYQSFEAKRNLSNMYDVFLCDERVTRFLPRQLGKSFYGRKRHPIAVDLQVTDVKKEIERVISGTRLVISGRGSTTQVVVAHTAMTEDQAVQNVLAAAQYLAERIPGGATNIKNIHLRLQDSPALPIFFSDGTNEEVTLPERKRKVDEDEPEEISTLMKKKVKVSPTGEITFYSMDGEKLEPRQSAVKNQTPSKSTRKRKRAGKKPVVAEKEMKAETVELIPESKQTENVKGTKSSKVMRLAPKDSNSDKGLSKSKKTKKNLKTKSLEKKADTKKVVKSKPKSKTLKT